MTQNTKDDVIYDEPQILTMSSTSAVQLETCPAYEVAKPVATSGVSE